MGGWDREPLPTGKRLAARPIWEGMPQPRAAPQLRAGTLCQGVQCRVGSVLLGHLWEASLLVSRATWRSVWPESGLAPSVDRSQLLGAEKEDRRGDNSVKAQGKGIGLRGKGREQKINDKLPGSHLVLIAPVVINMSLIIRLSAENHLATLRTQSGPSTPHHVPHGLQQRLLSVVVCCLRGTLGLRWVWGTEHPFPALGGGQLEGT